MTLYSIGSPRAPRGPLSDLVVFCDPTPGQNNFAASGGRYGPGIVFSVLLPVSETILGLSSGMHAPPSHFHFQCFGPDVRYGALSLSIGNGWRVHNEASGPVSSGNGTDPISVIEPYPVVPSKKKMAVLPADWLAELSTLSTVFTTTRFKIPFIVSVSNTTGRLADFVSNTTGMGVSNTTGPLTGLSTGPGGGCV